jgi:hypothetical protein
VTPPAMMSRRRCQRLCQIGNQIVGMLDAERQADRWVQHADTAFLPSR